MDFTKGYVPPQEVAGLLQSIKPLFLVGPSGSGKDTVQEELLKSGQFYKIVTYTTRKPRVNSGVMEKEGDDYHFINLEKAKTMVKDRKFIELTFIHGNIYGTSQDEFAKAKSLGKTPVLDIDVKGVASYHRLSNNFTAVFLLPTSFDVMLGRLLNRYGSSLDKEILLNRLQTSLTELQNLLTEDYYYVIVNDFLDKTVDAIKDILSGKCEKNSFNEKPTKLARSLITDINKYLKESS